MKFFVLTFALLLQASAVLAMQSFTVAPDGFVRFQASTKGITRISIKGDRIRKIVNAETSFEMSNDEETGDVFLRFMGDKAQSETGYIVTEQGVTLSYELNPVKRSSETVLITIQGQESRSTATGFSTSTGSSMSDPVAVALTTFVREAIAAKIGGKPAPKRGNGSHVATHRGDNFSARILVARAGKSARLVRQQDFYKSGILAVWVSKQSLAPGEAAWVVTVTGN